MSLMDNNTSSDDSDGYPAFDSWPGMYTGWNQWGRGRGGNYKTFVHRNIEEDFEDGDVAVIYVKKSYQESNRWSD